MYNFRNDYSEACHPAVLEALTKMNAESVIGYGCDDYCKQCADLIRDLCKAPHADVQFLVGGTQTNFTAIAAFLRPWESVICAHTAHVNGHEAGAVEATGHKLLQAQAAGDGKLTPAHILPLVEEGKNEHVTKPRLVYISDATETGAVYTRAELAALSQCCRDNDLLLFLDGARLGCALSSPASDLTLPDLAALTRTAAPLRWSVTLRDRTRVPRDLWAREREDSLTGLFLRDMRRRIDAAGDDGERSVLEQAVRFGLAALENGEDTP